MCFPVPCTTVKPWTMFCGTDLHVVCEQAGLAVFWLSCPAQCWSTLRSTMVLFGRYRTPVEYDENKMRLKTGPLTARKEVALGMWWVGFKWGNPLWSNSTPGTAFALGYLFFLEEKWSSNHSKMLLIGREQNLMWLGSNEGELLLFQLMCLQKGRNDQSWCGLNQVIFLSSFFKTTLSYLLLDNRLGCSGTLGAAWYFFPLSSILWVT